MFVPILIFILNKALSLDYASDLVPSSRLGTLNVHVCIFTFITQQLTSFDVTEMSDC